MRRSRSRSSVTQEICGVMRCCDDHGIRILCNFLTMKATAGGVRTLLLYKVSCRQIAIAAS